ncbi:hypothetical protein RUM44_003410 [Polyplax serrata]|uniref:Uncharacterized protein n=1 Tax=Polyplax serrata TaxID=468196 RepID=A0ABR1AGC3_POLSC
MHSNWKICQSDVTGLGQCEDLQNNCDKCGKLYRYNWRRRRTREKTCNLCVNEIKCNPSRLTDKPRDHQANACEMNFGDGKPYEDCLYVEKRVWDSPLAMYQYTDSTPLTERDTVKKVYGVQDFTEQLLHEVKIEFSEEMRNPQKPVVTDFEWPTTDQLNKVDCLRAFNIMKQILLQEMSACEVVAAPNDPLVLRKKYYLERRFQSLEREKIRRLKVYESLYIKEEAKGGL